MTAPLVDIRNATFDRGRTRVFDGLSLRIDRGEHAAIIGPNGAGKSTLLKALNRELYPRTRDDTRFRLLGRDRWNVWELRDSIGFVSADLERRYGRNSGDASVLDVILSGFTASIGVHGLLAESIDEKRRARARALLAELKLEALESRPFRSLSSGQQRLSLLARALVHEPHTLVLDEPGAGLDLAAGFALMRRLRHLARDGVTLLIATHQLNEILPEIDRVILLGRGRVLADGRKDEVLKSRTLSDAYATDIRVVRDGSWYFAAQGDTVNKL